jgi:hypothetical protein
VTTACGEEANTNTQQRLTHMHEHGARTPRHGNEPRVVVAVCVCVRARAAAVAGDVLWVQKRETDMCVRALKANPDASARLSTTPIGRGTRRDGRNRITCACCVLKLCSHKGFALVAPPERTSNDARADTKQNGDVRRRACSMQGGGL